MASGKDRRRSLTLCGVSAEIQEALESEDERFYGSRQKPHQTAMQMTSPTVIPVENLLQRNSTAVVLLLV